MSALTDRERQLIVMAWQCFKSSPQVNYKKLAELGDYKTAASANACYLAAKKKMLSGDAATKLTAREREVLVLAWQCFEAEPQVDYGKLAEMGKYKTTASANACYLQAKKKLLSLDSSNKEGGVMKPTKGKRKNIGVGETPVKKAKRDRPKESTATKQEPSYDDVGLASPNASDESTAGGVKHEFEGTSDEPVGNKLFATAEHYIKQEDSD